MLLSTWPPWHIAVAVAIAFYRTPHSSIQCHHATSSLVSLTRALLARKLYPKTHYSSSKILKRGVRFLPVLFIFIELSPIPMFIAGHDNERNQTEKQRDPSQSQRPSLDQVLPLPPPQNSANPAARRRVVALARRRRRHWRSLNVYLRRITTVEI